MYLQHKLLASQSLRDLPQGLIIKDASAAYLFEHHAALLVEHAVDAAQGALGALHLHLQGQQAHIKSWQEGAYSRGQCV